LRHHQYFTDKRRPEDFHRRLRRFYSK